MRHDHVSDFAKAAPRRLADALELLEEPTLHPNRSDKNHRHLCAARYLAGYTVECILKVYIINRTRSDDSHRVETWSEVLAAREERGDKPDLSGAQSHNLSSLLLATDLGTALDSSENIRVAWGQAAKWDYAERYMGSPVMDRPGTEDFVSACRTVYEWVQPRT
jgi:hypothetical protein